MLPAHQRTRVIHFMRKFRRARVLFLWLALIVAQRRAFAATFTSGSAKALKFGTHEIGLTGNGGVPNPFHSEVTVKFTPPSGSANAVTVQAFYDGGNTWHARLYVSEVGKWKWNSTCATDAQLNAKAGTFTAIKSNLRGLL